MSSAIQIIGEGVWAEMSREVDVCSGVVLVMGYLLILGPHGGRHHMEEDDGRSHCLTKHVLSSENMQQIEVYTLVLFFS